MSVLPPFIAEHAIRPARVIYDADWPAAWKGNPWPWCPKAAQRRPPKNQQDAPVEQWEIFIPAVPHDAHIVNEGNTHCPGVEGSLPATPLWAHEANLAAARTRLKVEQSHLESVQLRIRGLQREIERQQALVAYAMG